MGSIDFKEIPESHIASGDQDRFELFARDFLEALGFRILEGPGRGIDRGRDLLVVEKVSGLITTGEKRWLVSAKHKAHSGRSVADADEPDPIGRVRKCQADGFMGFYSTIPSSGLDDTFTRIAAQVSTFVWDAGRIEQSLLRDARLESVLRAYFSASYAALLTASAGAIRYLETIVPIFCRSCGKDLLAGDGIVAFVREERCEHDTAVRACAPCWAAYEMATIVEVSTTWLTVDVYTACRGACDREIDDALPKGQITSWESFEDLRIPVVFMKFLFGILNNARERRELMTDVAFAKTKEIVLALAQNVLRSTTSTQDERVAHLMRLPPWAGGLTA